MGGLCLYKELIELLFGLNNLVVIIELVILKVFSNGVLSEFDNDGVKLLLS